MRLKEEPSLDAIHEAFTYQQEAVRFAGEHVYCAIFHEQGLGKTKIAIDTLLNWLKEDIVDTALIITKKSLIHNWVGEFSEHTNINSLVLTEDGSNNYSVFCTPTRVVLGHFEMAKKEKRRLTAWLRSRRVGVILDESAKIKNPNSDLTKTYFELSSLFERRIIMTGTPVANRPFDIWAQIYFLDSGKALGDDYEEFRESTDLEAGFESKDIGSEAYAQRLKNIFDKIRSFSVRETKGGGIISLPNKEYNKIICDWEPNQYELYRKVIEYTRATVIQNGQLIEDVQESVLKRLLRLIQIASNPGLIDQSYTYDPGKLSYLYELIEDITRSDEKAIIWTSFNENCDYLAKRLKEFGAYAVHGRMAHKDRNDIIDWFKRNESPKVLVATPGAAKEGLTLTVANHVIFYDRTYSLDDYLQAQDRIHRVSQVKTCYVYNMIMQDSIDEWIDSLIEEKSLAAKISQGDITIDEYTKASKFDFKDILSGILGDNR